MDKHKNKTRQMWILESFSDKDPKIQVENYKKSCSVLVAKYLKAAAVAEIVMKPQNLNF